LPHAILRRLIEIRGAVDEDRRLSSELQRDRRQVFGRRLHHDLSDCRTAGEKDVIELLAQERFRRARVPFDDRDFVLLEHIREDPLHARAGVRRQLARLEDHAISRCDRRHDRTEAEIERKVPGRDHEDDALRLVRDV
jgi:hypothetical protein